MDNQSNIGIIKNCTMLACEYHIKNKCDKDYSQKDKDFEEAKKAAVLSLEKQTAKKIVFNSKANREYEDYICPNCKDILQQRRKGATAITIFKYKYCHNCGQKLDWSEIK